VRAAAFLGPLSTYVGLVALVAGLTALFTASGSAVLKQVVTVALINLILVVAL
jgi:hypothetical protein